MGSLVWAIGALFTFGLLVSDRDWPMQSWFTKTLLVMFIIVLWPVYLGSSLGTHLNTRENSLDKKDPK